ncbi:MAG: ASCH domain-containing protein [Clostridiales bacterium]|nr:ASCH domain-containing protein [Clostridiales bacterium]
MTTSEFWQAFLAAAGLDKTIEYIECFHFDLTEANANVLLKLVLAGEKKATASSLLACERVIGRIPQVGDYSIVTDWNGDPRCVIETTAVTILPFGEMTFDICKREGEDDNLESWKEGHRRFFTAEGKIEGYVFSEDMLVVFEDFEVVFAR